MKKIKVAIASVLKPLQDPRAYYRMALSLRETNKYLINIIGFSIKNKSNEEFLIFSPIYCHKRTHWTRALAGLSLIKSLFIKPPKILIVTTYELLLPALFLKPFLSYKIIYDLQENYSINLQYNLTGTRIMRRFLIFIIKIIESISKPFIDHYFFAEQCYREEFPDIRNYTVLENKYYGEIHPTKPISYASKTSFTFLISGTLTEVYGVLEGIRWFKMIAKAYPNSQLILIGHVPMPSYADKIGEEIKGIKSIEAKLSDHPVSYPSILEAYGKADFCLMPYYQIPSIAPKIPSKLYEAAALAVPAIFSPNPKWEMLLHPFHGGVEMDFEDLQNSVENFHKLLQQTFFISPVPANFSWKSEEERFLNVIENLEN